MWMYGVSLFKLTRSGSTNTKLVPGFAICAILWEDTVSSLANILHLNFHQKTEELGIIFFLFIC